ncbi:hypothetical protein AAFC00_004811 [Neodothiora populina]|uniref:Peptidase A1 domain-containing protein n=1 Tax=Neodothiora populina TaxID=2781224 RepID=A0ABR3P399_9PEZI
MRPQYVALVASFLDSVASASTPDVAVNDLEVPTIARRADSGSASSTVLPTPISVEPSQYWEGNDGLWSTFPLQVGTPKQNIRVMVSTAGFNTWTINAKTGCSNGTIVGCEDSRGQPFYTNESLTWVPNSIWDLGLEINLDLDDAADYGFDTVTLGWQGSGLPTAEHMVIANLGFNTFWYGIFGLNPTPTNFSTLNDPQPSFMQTMKNNNTIPSLSWAYTAGNQYRFSGVFGSLTLGGYDQSKFTPTNVTIPLGADISRDLLIGVQSISTQSSSSSDVLTSTSGGFYAFIDSTLPYLWLPESVCQAFEDVFGLVWDDETELYLVNDTLHDDLLARDANVTFTLGESASGGETVEVVLPYAAFDLEVSYPIVVGNSTHYFPLKRAANSTQYTLGRTFLQEAYVIADYERRNFTVAPCAWEENPIADIKTILSPDSEAAQSGDSNSGGGISGGAIAGIVIGVIGGLALVAAAIWFFMRKRRTEKQKLAELESKNATLAAGSSGYTRGGMTVSDTNSSSSDTAFAGDSASKPFISQSLGQELGGDGEIHEMQAVQKPQASEMEGQQPYEYYGPDGQPKLGVPGSAVDSTGTWSGSGTGTYTGTGTGTWQSHLSEVEGNNEPIYEMMGSEVHEMPDSRRQSWAEGEEGTLANNPHSRPTLPPSYVVGGNTLDNHGYPRDEKSGQH